MRTLKKTLLAGMLAWLVLAAANAASLAGGGALDGPVQGARELGWDADDLVLTGGGWSATPLGVRVRGRFRVEDRAGELHVTVRRTLPWTDWRVERLCLVK